MRRDNSSTPIITVVAFLAFLIFGFMDNIKGPAITDIKADLSFSYAQGANILLFAYIGFVLATLISGYLSDRSGEKIVLSGAGIFISAGTAGYFFSSSLALLFASSFSIGLGLGSMLAPLYAGLIIGAGFGWRPVYGMGSLMTLSLSLFFLFLRILRERIFPWAPFSVLSFSLPVWAECLGPGLWGKPRIYGGSKPDFP